MAFNISSWGKLLMFFVALYVDYSITMNNCERGRRPSYKHLPPILLFIQFLKKLLLDSSLGGSQTCDRYTER